MKSLFTSFPILLGVGLLCFAAAPPTTPVVVAVRADDQLDYLFLGSDRPVLIRLHVRMGDRPYDAPWVEFMNKLFAWFDKDKDGFLSEAEVARLPGVNSLLQQAQGSIGQNVMTVAFAQIDTNKDGKVSKEEFRAFYRNGGFPGFRFTATNFQAATARQINEGIFKRLDKEREGFLTADKVAGMYDKLRSLDENEDEMLTAAELTIRGNGGAYYEPVGGGYVPRAPTTAVEPSLQEVSPSLVPALVKQILDKYDRDKDGKLTPAEIGLAPERFAALDADKDGFLSSA